MGLLDKIREQIPNTAAGRRAELMTWLHEPNPEDLGHGTNDPDAIDSANQIFETQFGDSDKVNSLRSDTQQAIAAVIEAATQDAHTIKEFSPAGSIRHVSRSADIARELLYKLQLDPDLIVRMCIGDVKAPDFLKGPLKNIFNQAHLYHEAIAEKLGHGYEVGGKGLEIARKLFFKFIDKNYGFSRVPGLQEKFTKQSALTNGGMGALSIIGSAMTHRAMEQGKHHRFVYPDNSFGTWKNIAKLVTKGREENTKTIKTTAQNRLHPSPEDIDTFYQKNPIPEEGLMETWCLTPVSNPGGTMVEPGMLKATIKAIKSHNPAATIILDSVYIRTLKPEIAQNLVGPILEEPELLDMIVFVESFSKSHGVCGEREGMFFTQNTDLFDRIQRQNMTLFAGPGLYKSALLLALCTASKEEDEAFDRLHQFWAAERKGLYTHLMKPEFKDLFEESQPHIVNEQLEDPLGLYVFLKLKPEITFKEVALATHIMGVEEKEIANGPFIRFSVGTITKPTYSEPPQSARRKVGEIIHGIGTKLTGALNKATSWMR